MEQFSLLLQKGLDTKFMIEICFKEHEAILERLGQGQTLTSILTDSSKSYFRTLKVLCHVLPLKQAILCEKELEKAGKSKIGQLIKNSIYPLFLFLFSGFMILFFRHVILPSMSVFTKQEHFVFLSLMEVSFLSILILISGFLVLSTVLFKHQNGQLFFYRKVLSHLPLLQKIFTIQFALRLSAFLGQGISTMRCIDILCELPYSFFVSIHAKTIQKALQNGEPFQKALSYCVLDPNFFLFFQIGTQTSSLKDLLQLYILKAEKEMEQRLKTIQLIIQIISYISVGIVVLVVYQILLMPMNMLNTL